MFAQTFGLTVLLCVCFAIARGLTPSQRVFDHVKDSANQTFREPAGILKYKYLVPSGPYNQMWDWDSLFMGVAMFQFGSAPYLLGSMMNFLDHTDPKTGEVQGCLLPSGATGTIFHAKPVIIQGAWLAANELNAAETLLQYRTEMKALLEYWRSANRTDTGTGLPKWYNQLESGQDNLPLSSCASERSPECWDPDLHELVLVSADLATFLYREYEAFALFNAHWANASQNHREREALLKESREARKTAEELKEAINTHLWDQDRGFYIALNTSKAAARTNSTRVYNRVDVFGFPLWAGLPGASQAKELRSQLLAKDMLSPFGFRSTSSQDPRYNNVDEIKPYSNWQGPVWVNANAVLSYGLLRYGYQEDAVEVARRVVKTLSDDLVADNTWHEGYDSETGKGLAADGFLSWNTLGATLEANVRLGKDPFSLQK